MQQTENIVKGLYERLTEAGIECWGWYSDLHCYASDKAYKVLREWQRDVSRASGYFPAASTFICNITERAMIDVPFEYKPFWDNVAKGMELRLVKG